MKRMFIERYMVPPEKAPADGLPPMPALPPRDGFIRTQFIGKQINVDGWSSESLVAFAKQYGRTCAAALDVEIDVLKVERDALKARLDELQQ